MNSLATFTLFLSACGSVGAAAVSAPREVSGAVGQTVTVHCGYERRYARRAKYWCRGKPYESCREVVRTGGPAERDRTSITDDRNARVFSVTISSLQPHDPDSYWCVVSLPFRNVFAPVRLYVHQPTGAGGLQSTPFGRVGHPALGPVLPDAGVSAGRVCVGEEGGAVLWFSLSQDVCPLLPLTAAPLSPNRVTSPGLPPSSEDQNQTFTCSQFRRRLPAEYLLSAYQRYTGKKRFLTRATSPTTNNIYNTYGGVTPMVTPVVLNVGGWVNFITKKDRTKKGWEPLL
ncbi:uncharacterized protein LOC133139246 isoform X1 [Conger conger]|uniref:uncharacterized protein LOC133139246 isoform X1 n=1 Tax=Conger conger TaxID=82655 RepID=UPI002A59DD20|nr:uncharacterized protein LOC133139246 isoform X1 [Conger conger]